jgi:RimJ/RimL family protein N-acetyltransferase
MKPNLPNLPALESDTRPITLPELPAAEAIVRVFKLWRHDRQGLRRQEMREMAVISDVPFVSKMGVLCTVRTAQSEDAAAMVAWAKAAFATTETVLTMADEFTFTEEEERSIIEARAQSPLEIMLVTLIEGQVVAIAGLEKERRRRILHNVTLGIMIDERYRDQGIGHAMMRVMMDWARANPAIERVCLAVMSHNDRAIRLYERHGFVEEGRRVKHMQPLTNWLIRSRLPGALFPYHASDAPRRTLHTS